MKNTVLEITSRRKGRLLLFKCRSVIVSAVLDARAFPGVATHEGDSPHTSKTYTIRLNDDYEVYGVAWKEENGQPLAILNAVYVETKLENKSMDYLAAYSSQKIEGLGYIDVWIAVGVPTYRRVDDVTWLAAVYQVACRKSAVFAHSPCLFIVNNDSGDAKVLSLDSEEQLTLLPNSTSLGGVEGNFRGACKTVAREGGAYFPFMDNGVRILKKTWIRTPPLLYRLRPTCNNQIISGVIYSRVLHLVPHHAASSESKRIGSNAHWQEDLFLPQTVRERIKERTDADGSNLVGFSVVKKDRTSLRVAPSVPKGLDATCWYSVISIGLFCEYGYSLPIFFQGYAQEFGIPVQCINQPLNGICVWSAFKNKKYLLSLYLGCRNNSRSNLLHCRQGRWNVFYHLFFTSAKILAVNNYSKWIFRRLVVWDFLEFCSVLGNGERLLACIQYWQYSFDAQVEELLSSLEFFGEVPALQGRPVLLSYFGIYFLLGELSILRCLRRKGLLTEQKSIRGILPYQRFKVMKRETVPAFYNCVTLRFFIIFLLARLLNFHRR